ncbi:hypothetical protein GCM10008934_24700 [Virgibacillus salarius]|uniref:hypothetical protein n=1 Tax=Virgibacillus salarius TaxID=447199 RepID=UPI0031DF2AB7
MPTSTLRKAEVQEVIKVIVVEGSGASPEDPIKEVAQYWSKEGQLLFSKRNE